MTDRHSPVHEQMEQQSDDAPKLLNLAAAPKLVSVTRRISKYI